MPTAAKLAAAVLMAFAGYLIAESVRPNLPEGTPTGWLLPVSIVVPVICAWRVMGRLVGRSYGQSINSGLYAVAVSLFFVLFVFSSAEMLKRSTRKQYDGPTEAIVNLFGIIVEFGQVMLVPHTLGLLAATAVVVGLASEWTNRRWP